MSIRYTAYKLVAADGTTQLETDFQGNIPVKQELIRQVLADLQGITAEGKSQSKSELKLNLDEQTFTVNRDYAVHKLIIDPQPQPEVAKFLADWSNKFISVPSELNPQLHTQLNAIIDKFGQQAQQGGTNTETIKQEIVNLGGEVGTKYLEIMQKIEALEVELGDQKRMDESVLTLSELEASLQDIELQISSVHSLLEKQAQINQTLLKYGQMAQQDLEAEGNRLREQLEQLRQQQLVDLSREQGFDPVAASKVTESNDKKTGWHASYLALLGILVLIVGVGIFVLTENTLSILIATVVALAEFGLFGILNYIPSQIDVAGVTSSRTDQHLDTTEKPVEGSREGLITKIEKFFLDKAWVSALKGEAKYMTDTITTKLDGKNISELQTAQQNLRQNIANLKTEVEKFKAQEIPPQQYLQKRRELDMLSIDKARTERDLRNLPQGQQVLDLVAQMASQESAPGGKTLKLAPELAEALGVKEIVQNGELDPMATYAIVMWYRLQDWQTNPQSPFVIVEPLTPWANTFKVLVDNKLSELNALGQVVKIQLSQ